MKKIELVKNFSARSYQESLFANSIDKNTLIILPTGLGKTVVAIMLVVYYFNKTNKKILFLAPTKPLVEQQEKSFKDFFKNKDDFNFQLLNGLVSPSKRKNLYEQSDFIFSTPQLIENDIINGIINPEDFCLIVFDEAHRATGNYSYNFIAEQFDKKNSKILALSASPGSSLEEINAVRDNLRIENIQVKRNDDFDVKAYVKETKIEIIKIELDDEFKSIRNSLNKAFEKRFVQLKDMDFLIQRNYTQITKRDLLELQTKLRLHITQGDADENIWKAISISAALMKLQYGIELFESQEISSAHTYFYNFFRAGGDNSKAAQELIGDIEFRDAFDRISKLNKNEVKHPKLIKLKEIVNSEILKNKDLKIIIFNQYRDTASKIVSELSKIKEIKPALFVGQAKKLDVKLSQKDQKKILDDFREGNYNIIVSTSVGEEGLDIPKVDLVIFYEPVPSAIRTIQRIGRTGRFKEGKAYILVTDGTRDVITRHIANAKEKKMYKVLDSIINEGNQVQNDSKSNQKGLTEFLTKKENPNTQINNNSENNHHQHNQEILEETNFKEEFKPLIYIDNRENNDLIKELFRFDLIKVQAKSLDVGDIIISENIAIERKSKIDFVNSILDKRLFSQLIDLAKNYKRPILIIEGEENIFSLRNINPNVIRSTLSAIAIDLRIPIIYTNDLKETSQMILTITKRVYKEKKDISLAQNKSSHSEDEELEKFISTIPKINVVSAKSLLKHFKSIKELINADEKKISECEGVGKIRAKYMYEFFRREYKNS